jgi:hypothetical protein
MPEANPTGVIELGPDGAMAWWVSEYTAQALTNPARKDESLALELRRQADLLRELFGNPFRPAAVAASWLTPVVVGIAQEARDSDDWGALPVLADALEESGCTDVELLAHLRGSAPHCRGCWALDSLLAKE